MKRPVGECTDVGGRGCPCPWHAAMRVVARDYARQARAKRLNEQRRTLNSCPKRRGVGVCGGRLETQIIEGRTVIVCPVCDRQARGICRDCPRPVDGTIGKAFRCAEHKVAAAKEAMYRSGRRLAAKNREKSRAYYRDNPEIRARRNEYKRQYRKANPDKVREQKRRYVMRKGADKDSRYLEYHRRYNAQQKRQETKRAQAKAQYYEQNPTRPDPKCRVCQVSIPWTPLPGGRSGRPRQLCDEHCPLAERRRRAKVAAAAAAREDVLRSEPSSAPKIRVRNPMPARYAETGERLCFTPGCDIVVTHRKKKCTKCRLREQQTARERLAAEHVLVGPRVKRRAKVVPDSSRLIARHQHTAPRADEAPQWAALIDRGLTTVAIAGELSLAPEIVAERVRLAGGDLIGRLNTNNLRAEKAKRSIAAAVKWAKPRQEAAHA